ncbi:MAG: hypothetical protein IPN34_13385 [Planctomycetes bacterium]|nr:hypothetical protein [Planctomycetota bacterium]
MVTPQKSIQETVSDAVRETAERRSSALATRRRVALEISAAALLALGVEALFSPRSFGSLGLHPHPYWIAVLMIATLRGLLAGLATVAAMVLLYGAGIAFAATSGNFSRIVTLENFLEPVLWCVVTYVVGQSHDRWASRHRDLEEEIDALVSELERLRGENQVLTAANKILERGLVDQTTSFRRLSAIAHRMDDASGDGCLALAMELVHEHLGVERAAAFQVLPNGALELRRAQGWSLAEHPRVLGLTQRSEIVRDALQTGDLVDGFAPGAHVGDEGPLVAMPLFDAHGALTHLLTIDQIPASRLLPTTVGTFSVIGTLVQSGIQRADRALEGAWWEVPAEVLDTPERVFGSPAELGAHILLEAERVNRYGGATSCALLHAPRLPAGARSAREELEGMLQRELARDLRDVDQVYRFGYPGCYVALLSQCDERGARAVLQRWRDRLEDGRDICFGGLRFAIEALDAKAPDAQSLLDRLHERFQQQSLVPLPSELPVHLPTEVPLGRKTEFYRRLRIELGLTLRHRHSTHLVLITGARDGADEGTLLAKNVRTVANDVLRKSDSVFALEPNRCAVLLPCTDREQAGRVHERLADALARRFPAPPYGGLDVSILTLGAEMGALLEALAELDLELPVAGEIYDALGGVA